MYVCVIETREMNKVISQARVMDQAFCDYNQGKLVISGHSPLPQMPPSIANAKDVRSTALEMKGRFKRIVVEFSEDGTEPFARLPAEEDLPVSLDDPTSKQIYEALASKHGLAGTSTRKPAEPAGNGGDVPKLAN